MGKSIYPLNKGKYWRCYDVDMLGRLYGVHEKTILGWKRKGLKPINNKKPFLFYGYDVKEFVGKMNEENKCSTEFHQLFCSKCQEGKDPFKKEIQLIPANHKCIKITALCRDCKSKMFIKPYKLSDLPKLKKIFKVVQLLQLYDCEKPTVNTPFIDQTKNDKKESQKLPTQLSFFDEE